MAKKNKLKKGYAVPGRAVQYTGLDYTTEREFRKRYGDDVFFGELFNYGLNQESADKQMQFQDYMSSTAHQREVSDLQAAGLNPILAANGGAAAASGAMGTADATALNAKNQRAMNNAQIQATKQLAKKDRALTEKIASNQLAAQMYMNKYQVDRSYELGMNQSALGYQASVYGANASAAAQRYAASQAAQAAMYSANVSAAAQRYYADQSRSASEFNSQLQYRTGEEQRKLERTKQISQQKFDKMMAEYNYTHQTGLFGTGAMFLNSWMQPYFNVFNNANYGYLP